MILLGALIALVVVGAMSIPKGEVVTLVTTDAEGEEHHTQIWVVELDGALYIRCTSPDAGWLARLRAHPDVSLVRGGHDGVPLLYRAVTSTDPATRRRRAGSVEVTAR